MHFTAVCRAQVKGGKISNIRNIRELYLQPHLRNAKRKETSLWMKDMYMCVLALFYKQHKML